MVESAVLSYAFGVGSASFFSPCSVGLFPAYAGFFLQAPSTVGRHLGKAPVLHGLWLGANAAAGAFLIFVLAATLLHFLPLGQIGDRLPYVGLAIGAGILVLGVLSLFGRGPSVRLPDLPPRFVAGSMFAFGAAYALSSLGCTLPLFLSAAFGGLVAGTTGMTGAVLAYAAGMGAVMLAATVAIALAKDRAVAWLRSSAPTIARVAAITLTIAGLWAMYYWIDVLIVTERLG